MDGTSPLEQIASVLGLSETEVERLFGVRPEVLEPCVERGAPAEPERKVATLVEICEVLAVNVRRDRIPRLARARAPAYGGRSMLEAISAGQEETVLFELRDAFDWALRLEECEPGSGCLVVGARRAMSSVVS